MPPKQPEFVSSYAEFVNFRKQAREEGVIDLNNRSWLNSMEVLLLAYLRTEYKCKVISSGRSNAKGYLDQMTKDPMWWTKKLQIKMRNGSSYVPFSELPRNESDFKILFSKLSELMVTHKPSGGVQALKYVLGELTDNIYQHSNFKNSYMMGQVYKNMRYVELSFIDDGISIPGNFEEQ